MSKLNIEQLPDEDVTVIEGTRYANELLRTLGQHLTSAGPFVVENRGNGDVTLRQIIEWPESVAEDFETVRERVKQAAYKLDPECWVSYSGKPKAFKQAMEIRRNASLNKARHMLGGIGSPKDLGTRGG